MVRHPPRGCEEDAGDPARPGTPGWLLAPLLTVCNLNSCCYLGEGVRGWCWLPTSPRRAASGAEHHARDVCPDDRLPCYPVQAPATASCCFVGGQSCRDWTSSLLAQPYPPLRTAAPACALLTFCSKCKQINTSSRSNSGTRSHTAARRLTATRCCSQRIDTQSQQQAPPPPPLADLSEPCAPKQGVWLTGDPDTAPCGREGRLGRGTPIDLCPICVPNKSFRSAWPVSLLGAEALCHRDESVKPDRHPRPLSMRFCDVRAPVQLASDSR